MRDRLGHRPGGGRVFRLRGTGVFAHARLCSGLLLRPAEGLAGDQHAMQDHRQLARQRHADLLVGGPFFVASRPVLQGMGPAHHRQQAVGGLVEKRPE